MQIKKRGISLKRLDQRSPGMEQLTGPEPGIEQPPPTVPAASPDQENDLLVLPLDEIVLDVLEELEDTLDLLRTEADGDEGERKR